MTPFWLWVSAGCAACGLVGFSAVRLGVRRLWSEGAATSPPARQIVRQVAAVAAPERQERERLAAAPAPEPEMSWPAQPRAPEIVARVAALGERPETALPARASEPAETALPARASEPAETAAPADTSKPAETAAPARTSKPAATPRPAPAPTGPRPESAKLALWARQVKAGERKMSIATDGCRVTWNRTCKHGHPSWLVHLGYLKRHHLPRHTPR